MEAGRVPVRAISEIWPGFPAFLGLSNAAANHNLHPMRKVLRTKCRKAAVSF
jgi:hypothetical protein